MAAKQSIAVDFDGVIHLYQSPFTYPNVIPDDPVPGALDFLDRILPKYKVIIFSTRCKTDVAVNAMKRYLVRHWALKLAAEAPPPVGDLFSALGGEAPEQNYEKLAIQRVSQLQFTATKPAAHIYLDDRGWRFDGVFPSLDELAAFKPWNKN